MAANEDEKVGGGLECQAEAGGFTWQALGRASGILSESEGPRRDVRETVRVAGRNGDPGQGENSKAAAERGPGCVGGERGGGSGAPRWTGPPWMEGPLPHRGLWPLSRL